MKKEFETISDGIHSGCKEPERVMVKNQTQWKDLWELVNESYDTIPELPEVDFDKEMVIGVFMGQKMTGGYSIAINDMKEKKNKVKVYVMEKKPAPLGSCIMALTQPYHLVKTELTDKKIEYIKASTK